MHRSPTWFAVSLLAVCSTTTAQAAVDEMKTPLGLENVTLITAADNPLTAEKVQLGKQLFFDPRLSGSGTMSCSTCHLAELAFTDGKAVAKKDDGKDNTRNSPTMHNVGYLDRLYWDGRAKSLEGNVLAAWKAQIGGKPDEVSKKLAAVEGYSKAFAAAFGEGPSEVTITKALASFLRNLRSGGSAFDRMLAGEKDAMSEAATQGFQLFAGKAGCLVCHTPPLFTDRKFHNTGIGMAAEKPDVGAAAKNAFDDVKLTGAFKTPTLRDVAKTAPYFHDGSAKTLAEAVKVMAGGGIANPHHDPLLLPRMAGEKLTDGEQAQLVAFLESLSGVVAFVPPKLPQ